MHTHVHIRTYEKNKETTAVVDRVNARISVKQSRHRRQNVYSLIAETMSV